MEANRGYLVLENGAVFEGSLLGNHTGQGEVVFNTSMVGYEQILTDPSYAGQMVVMTYPLIGNYGFNIANTEAERPWVQGYIVASLCSGSEHYQQEMSLQDYLLQHEIPCLTGVDTRAITRMLRIRGTMGGIITQQIDDLPGLVEAAAALNPPPEGYVREVTREEAAVYGNGSRRIVLMDFGVKKSIITSLVDRDCQVFVVPATTTASQILELEPEGIILSNGPGDPMDCEYAITTIRGLIGQIPIFGICLGHQLLGLALGGTTRKLTFGHRGANQPVKDYRSNRVFMTSQNHSYMVDEHSLEHQPVDIVFRNLNDGTVEGMAHRELPLMSVQFHPEAAPGPQDTRYLMDDFVKMVAQYHA